MVSFLFTAFISGFATLSSEILASRVMAPLVGNSVYTWTAIIGTVLGGMALGSYLGGRTIDAHRSKKILAYLLLGTALAIALIPLFAGVAPKIVPWKISFPIKIFIISLFLFLLPSFFLGTLYPAILNLFFEQEKSIGTKAGLVSGAGSLGGIIGALSSGFFLIEYFGTSVALYGISLTLFFTALLWGPGKIFFYVLAAFALIAAAGYWHKSSKNILFEAESSYYAIKVAKGTFNNIDSKLLLLNFDLHSVEGAWGVHTGSYQETAPLFSEFNGDIKRALVLGGGSYNIPKDIFRIYGADVTVVEIDPKVTETARRFFDLERYPIISIHEDGRVALKTLPAGFDLIVNDAFNSFISMPWHLATEEAHASAKKLLSPGGVYVVNVISTLEGDEGRLYQSSLKTFANVFPEYHVVALGKTPYEVQNIFLIGMNASTGKGVSKEALIKRAREYDRPLTVAYAYKPTPNPAAVAFSDEYAPTEWAALPLIRLYIGPYARFFTPLPQLINSNVR